ncbi:MAG: RDD family protein [Bacteroidota bacterium]|nr:RDD family protein [Bacteroidota bacterium]
MSEQKITPSIRFGSMILDHFIMTLIAMAFLIPQMITRIANDFKVTHEQTNLDGFGSINYLGLIGFALYFCKDCINGRSIGKRALKLQVVDNLTGQVATPLKCFIRNIFCILWPVEAVITLTNPGRRIGDRVANTKVVPFDPSLKQPKVSFTQIGISLILAYGLTILLSLPFNEMQTDLARQNINFDENSYNETEGKETQKLFADSLSNYLTTDIRVYDKIKNENIKYVSVIFKLKKDYLTDNNDFEHLKSLTIPLLLTKFPERTFVGQLKYVYRTSGSMQTRILPLDWRIKIEQKSSR